MKGTEKDLIKNKAYQACTTSQPAFSVLKIGILFFTILSLIQCGNEPESFIEKPQVEYMNNPLGLDELQPRFSWTINDTTRGAAQTAYQIIVSHKRSEVEAGESSLWDSGKKQSNETLGITYSGKPLESNTTYYWRVRIWNQDQQVSPWSSLQHFHTGFLDANDWQAEWITIPDSAINSPLFRNDFSLEKQVASAHAFVTGVGYYELYLNGKKVGNHVLDPAITNYDNKILYETYDLADQLKKGENGIGMWLGNGGYRIKQSMERWTWWGTDNFFGNPAALVQVMITFEDGTQRVITSNGEWKTHASPITYNNVFGGEDYDARKEQPGWSEAGFDDTSWADVMRTEKPGITLSSQLVEPMRVTQTFAPQSHINPKPDVHLYDLEQNIPGWWQIRVQGEAGAQVKVRASETLNDSLYPTPLISGDSISTYHPFHERVWTTYTLNGKGVETWEPRFFYSGFRYLEVSFSDPNKIADFEISGRVMHSDIERNGQFTCSDPLLNSIYEAAIWSQKGNFHGYPTDCPHREKGAYNGDGQVIAETSMHDFHMHPMYDKWLEDMRDTQYENGRIPNTSPEILGGTGGGVAWGSAYILIPWWMYQYYEDQRLLEDHYESMKRYMEYLHQLALTDDDPSEKYIINEFGGKWDSIGEWEAPVLERNGPNNPLTHTYYWYLNSITFARMAEVLNHEKDQRHFEALADTIKQAFNKKFFNPKSGLYGIDQPYQTYLLFALHGNLVPEGYRDEVLDNLITDIMETRNGHLGTGILGTKHLFEVLAGEGRQDVLHHLAAQTTKPSWGHWITNGATTLWEAWDATGSHNHQMFGTINEYFYNYLAGIRPPGKGLTSAGYKKIHIKPYIPADLNYAQASLQTVRGEVRSSWEKNSEHLNLTVKIPANASGVVDIPVGQESNTQVKEGDTLVWSENRSQTLTNGISGISKEKKYIRMTIDSGTYRFQIAE